MKEKIEEMIKMQKALDSAIYKEHNTQFDEEKCRIAIIDEIGELTHELKGNWCWWKKTQKPVDRQRVLEELVDIWHFAMSYAYHCYIGEYCFHINIYKRFKQISKKTKAEYTTHIRAMFEASFCLECLMVFTNYLGFTIDDVYNEYLKKNKENYERLANNY